MYKVMTLGTLLVALALAPVLSGGVDPERKELPEVELPSQDLPVVNEARAQSPEQARSCQWACSVCEEDQNCTHSCTEVGECGSSCGFIQQCHPGQVWNEANCSCE